MERIDLPLSQFTFAQKLDLMEAIWSDLAMDEKTFESPAWHEAVLRDRKKTLEAGKATVSDWEEAKDRIRKNISCKQKSLTLLREILKRDTVSMSGNRLALDLTSSIRYTLISTLSHISEGFTA